MTNPRIWVKQADRAKEDSLLTQKTSKRPPASRPPASHRLPSRETPGFAARRRALSFVASVLDEGEPLEYLLDREVGDDMPANDRALARAIAATTLRRKGQIDKILAVLMDKPLGKRGGQAMHILRMTAAQILFMEVPDHASVSVAMDLAKSDQKARHFSKLINGVLRTLARNKDELLVGIVPCDILPAWLFASWSKAYGAQTCHAMAEALCHEPYLDLSLKNKGNELAEKLGAHLLPNGSLRLKARGLVSDIAGFREGEWWVQDMAASLAPSLFGAVEGKRIADLCAAPGGKSAFLAARGAEVTAVDLSAERLQKLADNLDRLKLEAVLVADDVASYVPQTLFDGVLLDPPCSATGTARKHPDVLWLKSPDLVTRMVGVQQKLLKDAVRILKPDGILIYCTCSLQPAEGEAILSFIEKEGLPLQIEPVNLDEVNAFADIVRPDGTIRTRPDHRPLGTGKNGDDPVLGGLDGFFIARFKKRI